jgi:hypothetical protein
MIEKNIFQTWKSKTDIPANFRRWSETIRALNPEFDYCLSDDADNRAFIALHYPWFLATYDAYPAEIYRADAVRYFWLYHRGGVYIDMDSECLRPLAGLCAENDGVALGRMGRDPAFEHSIPNAVMMSSAREPFWLYVAHCMMFPQTRGRNPENLTGPMMLKAAVDAALGQAPEADVPAAIAAITQRLPRELRPKRSVSPIRLLPSEFFYPVNWADPVHDVYFRRRVILKGETLSRERALALFPNSYIVTYWTHSWHYPEGPDSTVPRV